MKCALGINLAGKGDIIKPSHLPADRIAKPAFSIAGKGQVAEGARLQWNPSALTTARPLGLQLPQLTALSQSPRLQASLAELCCTSSVPTPFFLRCASRASRGRVHTYSTSSVAHSRQLRTTYSCFPSAIDRSSYPSAVPLQHSNPPTYHLQIGLTSPCSEPPRPLLHLPPYSSCSATEPPTRPLPNDIPPQISLASAPRQAPASLGVPLFLAKSIQALLPTPAVPQHL